MSTCPTPSARIARVFDGFPEDARQRLFGLRAMIFDVAHGIPGGGPVSESLKWGQPSYVMATGTPVRLGIHKTSGHPAVFVHCQTRVLPEARMTFGADLTYDGNRAILLDKCSAFPEAALRQVIAAAMTYHRTD